MKNEQPKKFNFRVDIFLFFLYTEKVFCLGLNSKSKNSKKCLGKEDRPKMKKKLVAIALFGGWLLFTVIMVVTNV
ncbi:MAG TPA: hypothetical protein VMW81_06305 [Nitrospinota bacterium]|nr:hypothetical protein [Nitrospinota bacterium]